MRNKKLILALGFILIAGWTRAQLNDNQFNTGKECIILINSEAYEVLLSPKGDILKIYKELPGYVPSRYEPYYTRKRRIISTNEGTTIVEEIVKVEDKPVTPTTIFKKSIDANLRSIEFDFNSATLKAEDFVLLNEIASEIKAGSNPVVRINSYDNLIEKNADLLARNRANACKAYLLIKGVGLDRIQVRITSLQGSERKVTFEIW